MMKQASDPKARSPQSDLAGLPHPPPRRSPPQGPPPLQHSGLKPARTPEALCFPALRRDGEASDPPDRLWVQFPQQRPAATGRTATPPAALQGAVLGRSPGRFPRTEATHTRGAGLRGARSVDTAFLSRLATRDTPQTGLRHLDSGCQRRGPTQSPGPAGGVPRASAGLLPPASGRSPGAAVVLGVSEKDSHAAESQPRRPGEGRRCAF